MGKDGVHFHDKPYRIVKWTQIYMLFDCIQNDWTLDIGHPRIGLYSKCLIFISILDNGHSHRYIQRMSK